MECNRIHGTGIALFALDQTRLIAVAILCVLPLSLDVKVIKHLMTGRGQFTV